MGNVVRKPWRVNQKKWEEPKVALHIRGWLLLALENEASVRASFSPRTLSRARTNLRKAKGLPDVVYVPRLPDARLKTLYEVSSYALPLYHEILHLAGKRLHVVPHWYFAQRLGCSNRSVIRAIKALELRGLVIVRRRFKEAGLYAGRNYQMKSRQTGHNITACTSSYFVRRRDDKNVALSSGNPEGSSELSFPKKSHEDILLQSKCDVPEKLNRLSPGTKRLDDFRRPNDADLWRKIVGSRLLARLEDPSSNTAQKYRRRYWDELFDVPNMTGKLSGDPTRQVGHIKKTRGWEALVVTAQIEELAKMGYRVWRSTCQVRLSRFIRIPDELTSANRIHYATFCRLANFLFAIGHPGVMRHWVISQLDAWENMLEQGWMSPHTRMILPPPGFFISDKAQGRFDSWLAERNGALDSMICKDEMIAGVLNHYAEVAEAAYHRGEILTALQWINSKEVRVLHPGRRKLLMKFFGL